LLQVWRSLNNDCLVFSSTFRERESILVKFAKYFHTTYIKFSPTHQSWDMYRCIEIQNERIYYFPLPSVCWPLGHRHVTISAQELHLKENISFSIVLTFQGRFL
jgi:hypothetical protein